MQDREPDEFRESTSFFQIWLLFRQNRVALFSFYLFVFLIFTGIFFSFFSIFFHYFVKFYLFICFSYFYRTFSQANHAL